MTGYTYQKEEGIEREQFLTETFHVGKALAHDKDADDGETDSYKGCRY